MSYTFDNMSLWLACILCIFGVSNSANFTNTSGSVIYQGTIGCGLGTTGEIGSYDTDLYGFSVTQDYSTIEISTCGSSFDTYLYLYNLSFTLLYACDDCGDCGTRSILTLYDLNIGNYYIGVGGFQDSDGNYSLTVLCLNTTESATTTSYSSHNGTSSSYMTTESRYNYSLVGSINCGEYVNGETMAPYEINLYYFSLSEVYPMVRISTCGSNFDTYLYVYNATSFSRIYSCDDCGNCGTRTIATFYYPGTGDYYIGVGGWSDRYGNYTLSVECGNITTTTATPYTTYNNRNNRTSYDTTSYNGGGGGSENYTQVFVGSISCDDKINGATGGEYYINIYLFNLTDEYPEVTISTCGSSFDTYLYLYDLNGSIISKCDDCGDCNTRTELTFYNLDIGLYYIGVGGYDDDYGNYVLKIECGNDTSSSPFDTWECNHIIEYPLPLPCLYNSGGSGITAECIDEDNILVNYYDSPDCSGDVNRTSIINSTRGDGLFSCSYNDPCDYVLYSIYNNTDDRNNNCSSDNGNLLTSTPMVVNECYSYTNRSFEFSCDNSGDIVQNIYDCEDCDSNCLVIENVTNIYDEYQDFCVNFECDAVNGSDSSDSGYSTSLDTDPSQDGANRNFVVLSLNKIVLVLFAYFIVVF